MDSRRDREMGSEVGTYHWVTRASRCQLPFGAGWRGQILSPFRYNVRVGRGRFLIAVDAGSNTKRVAEDSQKDKVGPRRGRGHGISRRTRPILSPH